MKYTDEYRAKARARMRRRRAKGLHPCTDCPTLVSATATRCPKHAALHREEQLDGKQTERGRHWREKRAQGLAPRKKVTPMSVHRPLEPHSNAISRVIVDAAALLPDRTKYPDGYIGRVPASNRHLMERAAQETGCELEFDPIPFTGKRTHRYETKFAVRVRTGDCEALVKHFQALQVAQFTSHANAQEAHDEHSNQHQHHTDLCAG